MDNKPPKSYFVSATIIQVLLPIFCWCLPYARQTVADADYGVQRIKDMEDLKTGRLCIGTTFGLSALITDAIARFSEQYPEIHLEVMFLKQDELIDAVRERKVDFALTFEMMEKDDLLTEQPVKTYHLCAIVSDQNPLAQQATVSLRQLADYNICTPARGMNARRMFDSLTNKKGIELQPKLEINEIHTLLHLVRTGRWVAILVDSITHGEEGLCAVPSVKLPSQCLSFGSIPKTCISARPCRSLWSLYRFGCPHTILPYIS